MMFEKKNEYSFCFLIGGVGKTDIETGLIIALNLSCSNCTNDNAFGIPSSLVSNKWY